ncbi:helix-turn-helix transcriptional regulator [Acinetobacter bohemicus]|uniref:helix-turn-helix transcriptional regulator n=1 Tax=Acinetobacter bohemicus TaxID=1435036 RepID=UPI00404370D3
MINIQQAVLLTSLSKSKIYLMLDKEFEYYDPNFPKSIKISKNRVCWSVSEINQWIEAKLAGR